MLKTCAREEGKGEERVMWLPASRTTQCNHTESAPPLPPSRFSLSLFISLFLFLSKKTWFGNCPGLIEISDSFKNLSVVIRSTIRFMLSFTMSKLPLRTDQLLRKSEVKWMNVAIAKVVPIVRVSFCLALRTTPEKVSHILFKFEVKWMNMAMPWQSCTNS